DGLYHRVLDGDVLQKVESGGMFVCDDPATDQTRLESGELTATGPMYGHRMREPRPGSEAAVREAEVLAGEEIELNSFRHLGKLALGTRRPLGVGLGKCMVRVAEGALEVGFELAAGAYATAVMREVIKGESDFPE